MTKPITDILASRSSRHDVGQLLDETMSIFDWPALELEICQMLKDLKMSGNDCLRCAPADLESRITALQAVIVAPLQLPVCTRKTRIVTEKEKFVVRLAW